MLTVYILVQSLDHASSFGNDTDNNCTLLTIVSAELTVCYTVSDQYHPTGTESSSLPARSKKHVNPVGGSRQRQQMGHKQARSVLVVEMGQTSEMAPQT